MPMMRTCGGWRKLGSPAPVWAKERAGKKRQRARQQMTPQEGADLWLLTSSFFMFKDVSAPRKNIMLNTIGVLDVQ
jgi:hypothetical protein